MKSIKDYDKLICVAVKNDPLGFIDILYREADLKPDCARLLREAACVIANLMDQLGIPEKKGLVAVKRGRLHRGVTLHDDK